MLTEGYVVWFRDSADHDDVEVGWVSSSSPIPEGGRLAVVVASDGTRMELNKFALPAWRFDIAASELAAIQALTVRH